MGLENAIELTGWKARIKERLAGRDEPWGNWEWFGNWENVLKYLDDITYHSITEVEMKKTELVEQ